MALDVVIAIAVLLQIFTARLWRRWGANTERRHVVLFFKRASFVLTMGDEGPSPHVLHDPMQADALASLFEHESDRFWMRARGYLPSRARQAQAEAEERARRDREL